MAEDLEIEAEQAEETTPIEYGIWQMPADYTLELLHHKIKAGDITIPQFQRGYVWSPVQASRLIESFLMGLPIPPVFLFVEPDQRMLVIDGMQRLMTIFYFFEESFERRPGGQPRPFRLTGINRDSRLYGKQMSTLEAADMLKLKNAVLRAVQVQQTRPEKDHSAIYHIFERLNMGGTALEDQEVRNCVYQGKLNDLLANLNEHVSWREILGKPNPHTRKKDIQLILRYMALFHDGASYRGPMVDFLSEFMGKNRNPTDEFMRAERHRFEKACRAILDNAGSRPFHPRGFLNQAVFDSVFVAFARNADRCPDDMDRRLAALHADRMFQKHTTSSTTDPEAVSARLGLAEQILFGDSGDRRRT